MNTGHQDAILAIVFALVIVISVYNKKRERRNLAKTLRPHEWGTHIHFGDLPQVRNSRRITNYLRMSQETYGELSMKMEEVDIRVDLKQAQLRFTVSPNDQANPGVMHGGKSYLIVDSVIAALVMANFPKATPLTVNSTATYLAPCLVGHSYIAQAEVAESDPAKPKLQNFTYQIKDADSGKVVMTGSMAYFPKASKEEPKEVPEAHVLHGFGGNYLRCPNGTMRRL